MANRRKAFRTNLERTGRFPQPLEQRIPMAADTVSPLVPAVHGSFAEVEYGFVGPYRYEAVEPVAAVASSSHDDETSHDGMTHNEEHAAVLDLVPHSDATHTAVLSGDWSDPTIWSEGVAPGANARVVIPEGLHVSYDIASDDAVFWVRVDGVLDFARDADTRLVVDTFVVSSTGHLTIGDAANPIAKNVSAEMVFADNGAIDLVWDPDQLSRGLLTLGSVEIHGQAKTSHLATAADIDAGDTTLTLESTPSDWEVGDRIVLTGTEMMVDGTTRDEEFVIAAVDGAVITLDRPTAYDHRGTRSDLKPYVANYTRNVAFSTENHESVPASQRAHSMFMNAQTAISYAEFDELGRTDKSIPLDDFLLNEEGDRVLDNGGDPWTDPDGEPLPGARTNIRGRYVLHLHRTGVENQAVVLHGNAIWGSPGWGYVHHDSHAELTNNAAYNVFGSAFVSETGNETGLWDNNISIKSIGDSSRGDKEGKDNHDVGFSGNGFWFQGRVLRVTNNVTAGNGAAGFSYFTRGIDQLDLAESSLSYSRVARWGDTLPPDNAAIEVFRDNEAFASRVGLQIIKDDENQHHDVRSVIDHFVAWEVFEGMHLEYTSKYTVIDCDLIVAEDGAEKAPAERSTGINFDQNTKDMVINGGSINGFEVGVDMRKLLVSGEIPRSWHFAFIDVAISGAEIDMLNYDPDKDRILTAADLQPVTPSLSLQGDADLEFDPELDDRLVVIDGMKTDSMGVTEYLPAGDSAELNWTGLTALLSRGYYETADGEKYLRIDEPISDRATGAVVLTPIYVHLNDAWDDYPTDWLTEAPNLGPIEIDFAAADFNEDGVVNAADINLLALNAGSSDARFDLDGDGVVSFSPSPSGVIANDSDLLIRQILFTEYGDADLDRDVDAADFSVLSGSFNDFAQWETGDFSGDGVTTGSDFSVISGYFGYFG